MERPLSEKQHEALDKLATSRPTTRVIGWDQQLRGPVVEHSGERAEPFDTINQDGVLCRPAMPILTSPGGLG